MANLYLVLGLLVLATVIVEGADELEVQYGVIKQHLAGLGDLSFEQTLEELKKIQIKPEYSLGQRLLSNMIQASDPKAQCTDFSALVFARNTVKHMKINAVSYMEECAKRAFERCYDSLKADFDETWSYDNESEDMALFRKLAGEYLKEMNFDPERIDNPEDASLPVIKFLSKKVHLNYVKKENVENVINKYVVPICEELVSKQMQLEDIADRLAPLLVPGVINETKLDQDLVSWTALSDACTVINSSQKPSVVQYVTKMVKPERIPIGVTARILRPDLFRDEVQPKKHVSWWSPFIKTS